MDMNTTFRISIKKRKQSYWLNMLLLLLPFGLSPLNELLGLPYGVRYLLDVAWGLLLLLLLLNRNLIRGKGLGAPAVWVALFFLYTLLAYPVHFQSSAYYLWGLRNNFRFYAAFFAFGAFLKPEDAARCLRLLDQIFWIDIAAAVFQFFVLGVDGDYLGGIFGTRHGSNGYTNLFFLIIVTKSIVFYLNRQEHAGACLSKCAAALTVAAMAELKFFFVEFVLVIVLAVLLTDFTWRKFWVIIAGCAGVTACAALLTSLFPGFAGWFSVQWLLEAAMADRGYTSSGDLNRLNAIPRINALWLRSWEARLFGLGLGNCDTASFSFLNTPFFRANGDMHYSWIHYAMLYLETGYLGLFFSFGFFGLVSFRVRRMGEKCRGAGRAYCCFGEIMAVLCAVLMVYNASLRAEPGYMAAFALAVPFCCLGKGDTA